MIIEIAGEEIIAAPPALLWERIISPDFLVHCIPGCTALEETGIDSYKATLQLRVASVGGGFEGDVALHDKQAPTNCRLTVSGAGTLGHGNGEARFEIRPQPDGQSLLVYQGSGDVGGLVAGVGQRVLKSVSKFLIGKFFTAVRTRIAEHEAVAL